MARESVGESSGTSKKKTAQLNFLVPLSLARLIRKDAKRLDKSLDGVGEAILQTFYALGQVERDVVLAKARAKRMGRKVTL